MKKSSIYIIWILICLGLFSSCNKYKFTKSNYEWIPYIKGDILVFESNKNEKDSILIKEVIIVSNPDDPLAIFPNYHETLFISGEVLSKLGTSSRSQYKPNIRVEILKMFADKESVIEFNFSKVGDTLTYAKATYSINKLEELFIDTPDSSIKIKTDETYALDYDLLYIYWNKKFGYTKLEFKNGINYELKKFIRKGKNILEEYEKEIYMFVGGDIDRKKLEIFVSELDYSKYAWEAESLSQIVEVYNYYEEKKHLKDILKEIKEIIA